MKIWSFKRCKHLPGPDKGTGRKILSTLILLLSLSSGISQIQSQFPGFQAEGDIPPEFLLSVRQSYQKHLSEQGDLSDNQATFYLQNAYQVHQLLYSGKVLFNDEASQYIGKIADQILKHRSEIRKSLRFFAVASPEINAFATNDGIVLVNIGLLAQVKQEAQLAFILCHEISHYLHQHPLDIFLKGIAYANDPSKKILPGEQAGWPSSRYTKEKELEADRLGWELYLEAGYDPVAGLEAFELLSQAGHPFANIPFDCSWLQISSLPFPDEYVLDQLSTLEDHSSLERPSTHPEPEKRREIMKELMDAQRPEPGVLHFLDQQEFEHLKLRCRFEVVRLQLLNRSYEQALYHTYSLEQILPDEPELKRFKAIALYSLAEYANEGRFWDVHEDYTLVYGEQQRLNYLTEQLQPQEWSAIALNHVWHLQRKYPDDEALRLMSRDLMEQLSQQYMETLDAADPGIQSEQIIFFPAMLEMMRDSAFAADIGQVMVRNRQFQDLTHTAMFRSSPNNRFEPELDLVGLHLGLEKVVWVDPFYQVVRYQLDQPQALLESEEKEKKLAASIEEFSDALHFDHTTLSSHNLESSDLDRFRHLALLQTWVQERSSHDDLKLVSPIHNEVKALAEVYDTPYFIWMGCLAQQEPRKGKGIVTTVCILFPPLLPYAVWYLATPKPQTLIYTMVYNANNGQYEVLYPHMIEMKDRPDVIRSATYDLLLQLSEK